MSHEGLIFIEAKAKAEKYKIRLSLLLQAKRL